MNLRHKLIKWLGGEVPAQTKKPELHFTSLKNGRYTVKYGNHYLCRCDAKQQEAVETYFDAHYDGDIEAISEQMKKQFNEREYAKGVKRQRGKKGQPYYRNNIRFNTTKNPNRLRVQVNDMGKVHQLCTCYPYQKQEVLAFYNSRINSHSLAEIKEDMKAEFNLRR